MGLVFRAKQYLAYAYGIVILTSLMVFLSGCPGPSPGPSGPSQPSTPTGAAVASSNCGDYGQACCPGNYCDYGECNNGMCQHCGYFGEICCWQRPEVSACEPGADCIQGRCQVRDDYYEQCGFPGYEPCYDDYGPYCYNGVYDSWSGICAHCGFYEQPCCPNTDYPCDYGKCVNGFCKRVTNSNSGSDRSASGSSDSSGSGASRGSTPLPSTSSNSGSSDDCGGLNEDCCVNFDALGPMGAINGPVNYCDDGLECDLGTCVEKYSGGYAAEAYERPSGIY